MRSVFLPLGLSLALTGSALAQETAQVRMADGFDYPVGRDGAKAYYRARGFRVNGHVGEDWNGAGGGDSDLGDPVYSIAHGVVVYARDYRSGWGKVVIVRHAFFDNGQTQNADSLYAHLHDIFVREGQQITRGEKVGTIGNNRGMYDAHLHFELRKNLQVGLLRTSFARDLSNYWDPTAFIGTRRELPVPSLTAAVPINTFPSVAPPPLPNPLVGGALLRPQSPLRRSAPFKVDRFEDLRSP
jgi:murein DD-endopeptidase MepM/ murein hydrolase activator NlpD